ncbi:hypothetical protein AK812_SmicGene34638, partial [Symbiodinium microadriaticum]
MPHNSAADAWVAKMNAETAAKVEEKRKKEEEEAAKKKAAEEAAAERKRLFRTKSQLLAEEEEERKKERARRQEEEFGCAIAGGFEKGDFVLAQNNMHLFRMSLAKPDHASSVGKCRNFANMPQGDFVLAQNNMLALIILILGPSETDPQNRVSVAFEKREKAGYAQINVVHFEIKFPAFHRAKYATEVISLCDAMLLGEICWEQVVYKNTFLEVVDQDPEAVNVKLGRSASWPCLGVQVSEPMGAIIQAQDQKIEAEDSSAESPVECPARQQDAILNQSRMDPGVQVPVPMGAIIQAQD